MRAAIGYLRVVTSQKVVTILWRNCHQEERDMFEMWKKFRLPEKDTALKFNYEACSVIPNDDYYGVNLM